MRVLFVDDEEHVLEGIVRSLFHLLDEWEIETATGGAQALEQMRLSRFDVIVSDMRMPGMDGAELLRRVLALYPDVVRIVLSGHADPADALRVAPIAHQFLTKPCDATELQAVVERTVALQQLLRSDELRTIVGGVKKLPSPPKTYNALTRVLGQPGSGLAEVASVIQRDPAMSVKVLQLVNSAFFSNALSVVDVRQAVNRLGVSVVKILVLSAEVFAVSRGGTEHEASTAARLQLHGFRVAKLARTVFTTREQADDAFLAGLLVDVGTLVMVSQLPQKQRQAADHMRKVGVRLHEAELALWGVSHAQVGAYLLGLWALPPRIAEAVAFHHAPEQIGMTRQLDLAAAVHVANELIEGREPDEHCVAAVGLTERMEELRRRALVIAEETV